MQQNLPRVDSHSQLQPGKAGLVIKKDNTRHVASKDVEKVGNNKGRKAYQCLIKLGGLAPNKEKHYNNTANRYGTCYTLAFWTDYQLRANNGRADTAVGGPRQKRKKEKKKKAVETIKNMRGSLCRLQFQFDIS